MQLVQLVQRRILLVVEVVQLVGTNQDLGQRSVRHPEVRYPEPMDPVMDS